MLKTLALHQSRPADTAAPPPELGPDRPMTSPNPLSVLSSPTRAKHPGLEDILPRDTQQLCCHAIGSDGDLVIFEHEGSLCAIVAESHDRAFSIAHAKFNTRDVDGVGFGRVTYDTEGHLRIGLRSLSFAHPPSTVKALFEPVLPPDTQISLRAL